MTKRIFIYLFSMVLMFQSSLAFGAGLDIPIQRELLSTASEFVLRNYPDEPLITIKILGGVNKPGIYHVPKGTDVLTLFSLTGGVFKNADLERVVLRRWRTKEVSYVNLNDVIGDINHHPKVLNNGDIMFVNLDKPPISPNTLSMVTFVAAILGIVATGILVRDGL